MVHIVDILTPDEREAFFNKDSDRAKAIVLASIAENHLNNVFERAFIKDAKIWNELFQPSGPLGDFGTKIRIAYMATMIDAPLKNDLLIMSRIRNEFAHKLSVKSFDAQPIRDWIKNMHAYSVVLKIRHRKTPSVNSGFKAFEAGMRGLKAKALRTMRRTYIECVGHVVHHLVFDIEWKIKARGEIVPSQSSFEKS